MGRYSDEKPRPLSLDVNRQKKHLPAAIAVFPTNSLESDEMGQTGHFYRVIIFFVKISGLDRQIETRPTATR
jgi:hypothetical protein